MIFWNAAVKCARYYLLVSLENVSLFSLETEKLLLASLSWVVYLLMGVGRLFGEGCTDFFTIYNGTVKDLQELDF